MNSCQKASRSLQTSQLACYLGNATFLFSNKRSIIARATNMPLLLRPKEQKNRSLIYAVASPVPFHLPGETKCCRILKSADARDLMTMVSAFWKGVPITFLRWPRFAGQLDTQGYRLGPVFGGPKRLNMQQWTQNWNSGCYPLDEPGTRPGMPVPKAEA